MGRSRANIVANATLFLCSTALAVLGNAALHDVGALGGDTARQRNYRFAITAAANTNWICTALSSASMLRHQHPQAGPLSAVGAAASTASGAFALVALRHPAAAPGASDEVLSALWWTATLLLLLAPAAPLVAIWPLASSRYNSEAGTHSLLSP
jgi:hypothetical protein